MPVSNSVTVANGSPNVVGYLTSFVGLENDTFTLNGQSYPVASVVDTTHITLRYPWQGANATDQTNWALLPTSPYWSSNVLIAQSVKNLLLKIEGGLPFKPDYTGTAADRTSLNAQPKGVTFLQTDVDPYLLFVKLSGNSGDWSAGQTIRGLPGPAGASTEEAQEAAADAESAASAAAASQAAAASSAATAATQASLATTEANRAASYTVTQVGGGVSGLQPANNASLPLTRLDISAGRARDATNTIDIILASSMTKRLDAVWAAGTGNGGLDTGTRQALKWYAIWLIRNPTTTAVDILFSLSATNPTMPSGYTQKRFLHFFFTESTVGNIMAGEWFGPEFQFAAPFAAWSNTATGASPALRYTYAPTGRKTRVKGMLSVYAANMAAAGWFAFSNPGRGVPLASTDPNFYLHAKVYRPANVVTGVYVEELTDASGQVYVGDSTAQASGPVSTFIIQGYSLTSRDDYA